jgi:hypothetical protein
MQYVVGDLMQKKIDMLCIVYSEILIFCFPETEMNGMNATEERTQRSLTRASLAPFWTGLTYKEEEI